MSFARPLIISVAPNGSTAKKHDNPAVPYSAREIAAEIVLAAKAGAAIAHVHARTPDGGNTQDVGAFGAIAALVREQSDIIVEFSLGARGFSVEQALAPLELHPLMASFPMQVREDAAGGGNALEATARSLLARGVRPSLAVTSMESLAMVLDLVRRGAAGDIPCLVVAADQAAALGQAAGQLLQLTEGLPDSVHWWAMKGGEAPAQYALRALAIGLGGHVRVGFEDTLQTYDGSGPAPSNAWFVERMVALSASMARPVATPSQARQMLALGSLN